MRKERAFLVGLDYRSRRRAHGKGVTSVAQAARDTSVAPRQNSEPQFSAEESLAVHQAIVDQKINALLETYDLNGDGEITGAEINTVLQREYGVRRGGFRR